MEECHKKHHYPEACRNSYGAPQSADCPVRLARPSVLSHEGGHGLHESRRHQHYETADLFGNSHAGGYYQSQGVYDGKEHQKRHAHQEILKGNGYAYPQYFFDYTSVPS